VNQTDMPARAVIDLAAIASNVASLHARSRPAQLMAVVKADAYGHGLVPVARAAVSAGATWLGTAQIPEALQLRAAGFTTRIMSWLFSPNTDLRPALAADIDLSASSPWAVEQIAAAARDVGIVARIHLKADTGLGRAGSTSAEFDRLIETVLTAQRAGGVRVVGVWTHYALADDPGNATISAQDEVFANAIDQVTAAGIDLEVRHCSNSAATLTKPGVGYDLVRPGLAVYGLSPIPAVASPAELGLRPAMTLEADLTLVKQVPAGTGVSYGLTYTTPTATKLGLVPLGYADGIPRHASNVAPVAVGGRRTKIAGRVCMDQFVIDLGPDATEQPGDTVTLFGPGDNGEPTAEDWAVAADTISYEIVTRIGVRVPRVYVGGEA
jgi:alanine racemase